MHTHTQENEYNLNKLNINNLEPNKRNKNNNKKNEKKQRKRNTREMSVLQRTEDTVNQAPLEKQNSDCLIKVTYKIELNILLISS